MFKLLLWPHAPPTPPTLPHKFPSPARENTFSTEDNKPSQLLSARDKDSTERLESANLSSTEPIDALADSEEIQVSSEKSRIGGGKSSMGRSVKKRASAKPPTNNTNALDSLRKLAWSFNLNQSLISPEIQQELSTKKTVEELKTYLTHYDSNVMLEAAYRIGEKNTNAGISALESVLRVKGGNAKYRRRAFALLGDLHRKKNNNAKAEQAYEAAIRL